MGAAPSDHVEQRAGRVVEVHIVSGCVHGREPRGRRGREQEGVRIRGAHNSASKRVDLVPNEAIAREVEDRGPAVVQLHEPLARLVGVVEHFVEYDRGTRIRRRHRVAYAERVGRGAGPRGGVIQCPRKPRGGFERERIGRDTVRPGRGPGEEVRTPDEAGDGALGPEVKGHG